ncbi:MAG: MFS transporter [Deltaproteobacteria bacterium]|nr:MFS transporter [Candidatus Zymogenaceae bacterium]
MNNRPETFPLKGQLLYASGNLGWTMVDRIWITFMLYFYLPPAESGMTELISNRTFLGFLTVIGLATILARVVDAAANPLVASWSDGNESPLGRRKMFLLYGGLPLVVLLVMLFFPPSPEAGTLNAVWMIVILSLLLFFLTIYVVPWCALLPELSHTKNERINIASMQAGFRMIALVIVMIGGFALWDLFEGWGMDKGRALQVTILVFGLIALVALYLPLITLDEERYTISTPSKIGLIESLKLTFANKPFMPYLFGTICLWFAFNIVFQSTIYYVTVLLGKPESFTSAAYGMVMGVAFVFFPILNLLSRKMLKKHIMITGLILFLICGFTLYFLGSDAIPVPKTTQALVLFGLFGIPVAALLLLPNAILADIAEYDSIKTGTNREAMYFGAQGLLHKVNLGLSTLVLGFLLTEFGKDAAQSMGIQLTGPVVGIVCIFGIILFSIYPEQEVLGVLEENRRAGGIVF